MLWLFALREIKYNYGRLTLLMLLLALTASVLGGGFAAPGSISAVCQNLYERLHAADLDVTFAVLLTDDLPPMEELERIEGVAAVTPRLLTPGYLDRAATEGGPYNAGSEPFPVLIVWLDPGRRPAVDDLDVLAGSYLQPGQAHAALIDRTLARYQHVQLGDEVHVEGIGLPLSFRVEGVALSPEFLMPTANPDLLFPPKGSLGVLYASQEYIEELWRGSKDRAKLRGLPSSRYLIRRLAMARLADRRDAGPTGLGGPFRRLIGLRPRPIRGTLCNNLLFRFAPGADPAATRRRILDRLHGVQIDRISTRESNYAHRFLQEDLKGFYVVTPFGVGLLAVLGGVVVFLTVGRLVAVRRHDLGTLMALGFSAGRLARAMLLVTGVPAVLAGGLGLVGAVLFARALVYGYTEAIGLPRAPLVFSPSLGVLTALTPLAVALAASVVPLRGVLRLRPIEAIRDSPGLRFSALPRLLDRPIAHGRPGTRFALRNVFRRVKVSAAIVLTLALAIAMPAAFLTSLACWTRWVEDMMDLLNYDAVVTLQGPLPADAARALLPDRGIASAEPYRSASVSVRWEDGSVQEMRLLGLPAGSTHQPLDIIQGSGFSSDEADEVVLNRNFADRDVRDEVGRSVVVSAGGKEHVLRVVGLASAANYQTLSVPLKTADRILGTPGLVSGFTVRLDDGVSPAEMRAALLDRPQVARVQTREEIGRTAFEYVEDFRVILWPVVASSGLFCLAFLATVLGVMLRDRELEYAVLRALGAGAADIARVVLVEVLALALCAVACAAPLWIGLAQSLRLVMAAAWFDTGLKLQVADFAGVAVTAVGFLILAALPGIGTILRLPLARTLQKHVRD